MSKKLKTLKDLKIPELKWEFVDRKKLCSRIELKREAIKWIKELSKGGFNRNPQIRFNKGRIDTSEVFEAIFTMETDIVVRWIIHFFNISDEDLKEVRENE